MAVSQSFLEGDPNIDPKISCSLVFGPQKVPLTLGNPHIRICMALGLVDCRLKHNGGCKIQVMYGPR